jgi:hypothetical protein
LNTRKWKEIKIKKGIEKFSCFGSCFYEGKFYSYGGINREGKYYSELYCLDVVEKKFKKLKLKGGDNMGVGKNSGCLFNDCLYITGGICENETNSSKTFSIKLNEFKE